jgi:hypothetical protein
VKQKGANQMPLFAIINNQEERRQETEEGWFTDNQQTNAAPLCSGLYQMSGV